MPLDLTDDKSTLVQVMAWCRQATSHYLSQCWPRSVSPYGVTRPQWVNYMTGYKNGSPSHDCLVTCPIETEVRHVKNFLFVRLPKFHIIQFRLCIWFRRKLCPNLLAWLTVLLAPAIGQWDMLSPWGLSWGGGIRKWFQTYIPILALGRYSSNFTSAIFRLSSLIWFLSNSYEIAPMKIPQSPIDD